MLHEVPVRSLQHRNVACKSFLCKCWQDNLSSDVPKAKKRKKKVLTLKSQNTAKTDGWREFDSEPVGPPLDSSQKYNKRGGGYSSQDSGMMQMKETADWSIPTRVPAASTDPATAKRGDLAGRLFSASQPPLKRQDRGTNKSSSSSHQAPCRFTIASNPQTDPYASGPRVFVSEPHAARYKETLRREALGTASGRASATPPWRPPSLLRAATLMEAQESGELMEMMDEVGFAVEGLRQPSLCVQRASALSLATVCSHADRRALLRSRG